MKDITIDEFLECCKTADIPELKDSILTCIARFYRRMPQDEVYLVHGDSMALQHAMFDSFDVFAKYGIYPDLSDIKYFNVVNQDKDYIWYVDATGDLQAQYDAACEKFSDAPLCCVLLNDTVDSEVLKKIRDVKTRNGDALNVWNFVQIGVSVPTVARSSRFQYVDITQVLHDSITANIIVDSAVVSRVQVCKRLLEESSPSKIYYINTSASKEVHKLFVQIAAILTYNGVHFEVTANDVSAYVRSVTELQSHNYMFLDDYLRKIAYPLDVAIKFNCADAYVCVRQGAPRPVKLHIYATPLDAETMTIRQKVVHSVLCEYSQIETISLIDGLDDDFEHAITRSNTLGKLFAEFEGLVDEEIKLRDTVVLNFTNVIVYRHEGQLFIGYVARIDTSFVYALIPLAQHYKAFVEKMTLADYDLLCDINVFSDSAAIIKNVASMTKRQHLEVPKFAMGSLLKTIPTIRQEITEQSGLSFLEIAVWSTQTSQCRLGAQTVLLEVFNRAQLRNRDFLTVWGGCHPSILTQLVADSRIWR